MSVFFARSYIAAVAFFIAAALPAAAAPPAPGNLRPVQNKHDCAFVSNTQSANCDAAVRGGQLQLRWDEQTAKIDGYKIYRVDGKRHVLIATMPNGIAPAFGIVPKPRDGYIGKCYTVVAYQGSADSADSPQFCAQVGATSGTRLVGPDRVATMVHWSVPSLYARCKSETPTNQLSPAQIFRLTQNSGFTSFFPWLTSFLNPETDGSARQLNVAFAGLQAYGLVTGVDGNFVPACPANANAIAGYAMVTARTGLGFNLRRFGGHKIYSATLTLDAPQALRVVSTKTFGAQNSYSCATSLAVANSAWWRSGPMSFHPQGQATFGFAPVPSVTLDVTPIVAEWAGNFDRNDYGFVLRSRLEDGTPIDSFACMTRYANPRLEVVFF